MLMTLQLCKTTAGTRVPFQNTNYINIIAFWDTSAWKNDRQFFFKYQYQFPFDEVKKHQHEIVMKGKQAVFSNIWFRSVLPCPVPLKAAGLCA